MTDSDCKERRAASNVVFVHWQGGEWAIYDISSGIKISNCSAPGIWRHSLHTTKNATVPRALRIWYDDRIDMDPNEYLDKMLGDHVQR